MLVPYDGCEGMGSCRLWPLFHHCCLFLGGCEDDGRVRLDDVMGRLVNLFSGLCWNRLDFEIGILGQLLAAGVAEGRRFGCGHEGFPFGGDGSLIRVG